MPMRKKLKEFIDSCIPEILGELKAEGSVSVPIDYDLETPKVKTHGDVALNVALKLGRVLKRNPYQIALVCHQIISKKMAQAPGVCAFVKTVNVAQPGFLNFFLTEHFLGEELLTIARGDEHFGESDFGKGKKVIIEFVSANPTGPLTIAHGRQAAIGDSLARILKTAGFAPYKEFYLNDGGRQIRLLGESLWVRYQELFGRTVELPEDGYRGAYLIDVAKMLQGEKKDALLHMSIEEALGVTTQYAVDKMMLTIQSDLKDLDVVFDRYFSERSLYDEGLVEKQINALRSKNFVYEAEGALWFRSTEFGDDKDRVLKKQIGEYTYLAPDIAYHGTKFERGFRMLINLWGPDHHGYVSRLKAACKALGHSADEVYVLLVPYKPFTGHCFICALPP